MQVPIATELSHQHFTTFYLTPRVFIQKFKEAGIFFKREKREIYYFSLSCLVFKEEEVSSFAPVLFIAKPQAPYITKHT